MESSIKWDTWIKVPGVSPVELNFNTKKSDEAKRLATEYVNLGGEVDLKEYYGFDLYPSNLKVLFINEIE